MIGLNNFETQLIVKNLSDTLMKLPTYLNRGGLELPLACDLRVVTKSSIFSYLKQDQQLYQEMLNLKTPRVIGVALAQELTIQEEDKMLKIHEKQDQLIMYMKMDIDIQNSPIGVRTAKADINKGIEVDMQREFKMRNICIIKFATIRIDQKD
ncbi:unnamed protein product (macronuclear) [Paramecium tetraurelia]|uniref:Uncharacterized protein n=1 Tax=Paramecium tetraurelia TaxID=5888 RepID=A0DEM7_PARTE|nr:uncharacterized protein GSPATT00016320001 [Paramecium tetraurelia]CAK81494.1 unnamed protein product [Paramecium tetraurelia]|eukprot:XP_001448891.1 hypothetical protein (macronuclear) [Paramecium tetraurelia strain d4-2]